MRITEEKTETITRENTIGYKCDACGKDIKPNDASPHYMITTGHHDWGADSYESREDQDACSLSCCKTLIASNEYKTSDTFYFEISGNAAAAREQ